MLTPENDYRNTISARIPVSVPRCLQSRSSRPRSRNMARTGSQFALRGTSLRSRRVPSVIGRGFWLFLLLLWLPVALCSQPASEDPVRSALKKGTDALAAGDFQTAVDSFTAITHQLPDFAEGYFNLGLALQQSGRLLDARSMLHKSLQLKPGLRGAHLFLGIIDYRENRFQEAEANLLRETHLDPRSAKAFMWLGVCRLAEQDPRGAIAPLERAYELDPTDVDILYHRGHAYLELADQSYAAMYKQGRDSARVHQVLAEAYASGYRNPEAISEYELAIKLAPHQPGLHEDVADKYWATGQTDKAVANYNQELGLDPYAVSAKYKLGSLWVLHDRPQEGVKLLREVLKADPSLSDAHYYLATGLSALDQDDQAAQEFQSAIAADPQAPRAMSASYKLYQIYRKLHRAQEAQAAFDNFQRLRSAIRARQDDRAAQLVRSRTDLPVKDPDLATAAEP